MFPLGELKKRLDERRLALTDAVLKLVEQDAPKNRFAILTGRLREISETEMDIEQIENLMKGSES